MCIKRSVFNCLAILALFVGLNACQSTPPPTSTATVSPPETPTPVETPLPRLKVVGNQIQNESGERVVLHGVAIADPGARGRSLITADFEHLAVDWGVQIIRVPIHPNLWEHDPSYAEKYLDPIVEWGKEFGFYVFLGYHAHGNPITNQVEETPWGNDKPWHGNPYNPDLELAKSALAVIADRYKDQPHVVYGTFNEPSFIDWRDFRQVAEELVDVIHAINPDALVFVSGMDWGYDLCGAIYDPVNRENVVYEIHPYPWSGEGWQETVIQLSQTAPVFFGEWGFSTDDPDPEQNSTVEDYGLPLLQFADEYGLGWSAWVWDPIWTPSMLETWDGYTPTEFGQFVKDSLTGVPSDSTKPWETPTPYLVEDSYVIYDDALGRGWDVGVWDGEFDLASEAVAHNGQKSLSVSLDADGGINLSTSQDISAYGYLEFYINSGERGGQSLEIFFWDQEQERVLARRSAPCLYTPNEWVLFRFPLQGIDLAGKQVILDINARGSHPPPEFFLDDIRLVGENIPESVKQQQEGLLIFEDAPGSGWDISAWNGEIDLSAQGMVHEGQHAIEANLDAWGSFGMWTTPLEISDHYLEIYINGGSQGGQQINVLTFNGDVVLANLAVSDYTQYEYLPTGEWLTVRIPVEDLNPDNSPMNGIVIENHSDNPAATFYVDDIRFVAAGP